MSSIPVGTPDWQRGVVNAGKLLATVASGTLTVTVAIPPNTQTLAVSTKLGFGPSVVTVQGVQSGIDYPGTTQVASFDFNPGVIVYYPVLSQLDTQVTITLTTSTAPNPWYVHSLTGVDVVWVMGMSNLLQAKDTFVDDWGVNIMGDQAGNARQIIVDSAGHLLVYDQSLVNVIAARNAAQPADALLVGGSDGTDLRALATDSNGRVIPMVPTGAEQGALPAGTTQLLAAPSSAWYLWGFDYTDTSGSANRIIINAVGSQYIADLTAAANGPSVTISFEGLRMAYPISVIAQGACRVCLRYAPGP